MLMPTERHISLLAFWSVWYTGLKLSHMGTTYSVIGLSSFVYSYLEALKLVQDIISYTHFDKRNPAMLFIYINHWQVILSGRMSGGSSCFNNFFKWLSEFGRTLSYSSWRSYALLSFNHIFGSVARCKNGSLLTKNILTSDSSTVTG